MSEYIGELEQRCALAEAEGRASLANKSTVSLEAELNGDITSFDGDRNSDSDFEFRPAVAVERRNRNRLSIGDEIQQMNLPISQTPLHDREFRTPEVDTSDASTQTDDSVISSNGRPVLLGIICVALAAVFIYNFLVEVEYNIYI